MRKLLILFFSGILLFASTSCAGPPAVGRKADVAGSRTVSAGAGSGTGLGKVAPDVIFREGTASDGKIVLSSGDIVGFYTKYAKFNHSYQIVFQLTEAGKETFAEETAKLLGNTVSVWSGKKLVNSSGIEAPITDGSVAITAKDEDAMKSICKELEGQAE